MSAPVRKSEQSENDLGSFASFAVSRPVLDEGALIGLPGEVVRAIEPHTEADPVALLLHFLVMFGSAIGDGPHLRIGYTWHPARLFALIVGDAAIGRKGTAGDAIERLMELAVPDWYEHLLMRGAQSAEAIIAHVDDNADDSRLLILETEFGRLLSTMARRGNLSSTLKSAFDGKPLAAETKRAQTSLRATRAHIAVIGHITPAELAERLSDTDVSSGFASRFLYAVVVRSKRLPGGDGLDDDAVDKLATKIRDIVERTREIALGMTDPISAALHDHFGTMPRVELAMTSAFRWRWEQLYAGPLDEHLPGAAGIVTDRAAAHVLRLAVTYALADETTPMRVDVEHLDAAYAVWRYCVESAQQIFGGVTGSSDADRVLRELQRVSGHKLSRSDVWSIFGRHASKAKISLVVEQLLDTGLVERRVERTDGRSREVYVLREGANKANEMEHTK
jgi:hypothetical protein